MLFAGGFLLGLTREEYLRREEKAGRVGRRAMKAGKPVYGENRKGDRTVIVRGSRGYVGARTPNHGTRSEYVHGCRCIECRAAQAAYDQQRYRLKQSPELIKEYEASPLSKELTLGQYKRRMMTGEYRKPAHKVDTHLTHGTYSCYRNGKCRCDDCRHAASSYRKRWRANKEDQKWREGDQWL